MFASLRLHGGERVIVFMEHPHLRCYRFMFGYIQTSSARTGGKHHKAILTAY